MLALRWALLFSDGSTDSYIKRLALAHADIPNSADESWVHRSHRVGTDFQLILVPRRPVSIPTACPWLLHLAEINSVQRHGLLLGLQYPLSVLDPAYHQVRRAGVPTRQQLILFHLHLFLT